MTSKEAIFDIEINSATHGLNFSREIEVIKQDLEVLELYKKLEKTNYIYREDGLIFGFIGINFNDECKLLLYNEDNQDMFTSDLKLSDYNKTWKLKS